MDASWDTSTITEGYRALDHFVNRVEVCRRHLAYLNDEPATVHVTYLHGDGGNGKSLLLAYLRTQLNRQFDPEAWNYLATLSSEECVAQAAVAEGATTVPSARLDLEQLLWDDFRALTKIRRDLTGTGLRFPLFDFAVVVYLHQSHQLSPERIREIFPAEEVDFALELAQLAQEVPGAGLVMGFIGIVNRRLGNWFERYRLRRNLDDSVVAAILRMDHETELIQDLPRLFAKDLSAALGDVAGPNGLTIFIDNHGALLAHERNLPEDLVYQRDEWLRRLILSLEPQSRVIVVLAGREPPSWSNAPRLAIRDPNVQRVGNLEDSDAITYLEMVGISDIALQQQLCSDARVADNEIHPFSLGLSADLVIAASREGRRLTAVDLALGPAAGDRRRLVVNRLLRYVDAGTRDAVLAVAASRFFDGEIYRFLGETLGFSTSPSAFRSLVGFSFVQRDEVGRYRIHELVRRFSSEITVDTARGAHEALAQYYQRRSRAGAPEDIAELIYHITFCDWRAGFEAWHTTFQSAFQGSHFSLCEALLGVQRELPIPVPGARGLLVTAEGQYLQRLSRLDEAKSRFREAASEFDAALSDEPDDSEALINKGNVLVLLSEIELERSRRASAMEFLYDAVAAFDAAIAADPFNPKHVSNKANALRTIGKAEIESRHLSEALSSYHAAEQCVLQALQSMPDEAPMHQNLGLALTGSADVQVLRGHYADAEQKYRSAIRAFNEAIDYDPTIALIYNNKGHALHHLAKTYALRGRRISTILCYRAAITAVNNALRLAPDYPLGLYNKALFCEELSRILISRSTRRSIRRAYTLLHAGLRAARRVAALAPDDVRYPSVEHRLGQLLNTLGRQQAQTSETIDHL